MPFPHWRTPRIDRRTAERLLAGEGDGPDHAELSRLLSAAASPAHPGELAGEADALAAFRAAHRAAGPATTPASRAGSGRRLLAIKVAALAAVLLTGGTAFTAGTGRLPDPLQRRAHDAFSAVGVPNPDPEPAATRATGTPPAPPTPATAAPPATTAPADPSPAAPARAELVTLCRAWLAAEADPALDRPTGRDLASLVRAAHGRPRITDYCGRLVGAATVGPAGGTESPRPTPTKRPKDKN